MSCPCSFFNEKEETEYGYQGQKGNTHKNPQTSEIILLFIFGRKYVTTPDKVIHLTCQDNRCHDKVENLKDYKKYQFGHTFTKKQLLSIR